MTLCASPPDGDGELLEVEVGSCHAETEKDPLSPEYLPDNQLGLVPTPVFWFEFIVPDSSYPVSSGSIRFAIQQLGPLEVDTYWIYWEWR